MCIDFRQRPFEIFFCDVLDVLDRFLMSLFSRRSLEVAL